MSNIENFKDNLRKELELLGLSVDSLPQESIPIYKAFLNSIKKQESNKNITLSSKVNCYTDQEMIEKLVTSVLFQRVLTGKLSKLVANRQLRVLSVYVKLGLGENSKQSRIAARNLLGADEAILNNINKTLREKGLLVKGKIKESNNELCPELEALRKCYLYIRKHSIKELDMNYTFLLNDSTR